MFDVIGKQKLSPAVRRLDIRADMLVARFRPGQFVAVMPERGSRCVPMNVYEVDFRRRCLSLVYEVTDAETLRMSELRINDTLFAVHGPYGVAVPVAKVGPVIFAGEGIGLGSVVSLCRAFKQAGNKVIGVAGFDSRRSSILENQMRLNCSNFYVMYGDGMHERRGDLLAPLAKMLGREKPVRLYSHASLRVTSEIARLAEEHHVPLLINTMDALQVRPSFHESDAVFYNNERHLPARDGIWVPVAELDMRSFVRDTDAAREYAQCRRKEAELLASKSVWARLKKFIWG